MKNKKRKQNGKLPAQIRSPSGAEDKMTEAIRWPNNMAENRDQAAERIQNAAAHLENLLSGRQHTEVETALTVAKAINEINQAARRLEQAGAKTTPRRL